MREFIKPLKIMENSQKRIIYNRINFRNYMEGHIIKYHKKEKWYINERSNIGLRFDGATPGAQLGQSSADTIRLIFCR